MQKHERFKFSDHLSKKRDRIVISMECYDATITLIIQALQESIASPENDTGVTAFVIFGSWGRRNPETGPTAFSDIELFAYKREWLNGDEQSKINTIVKEQIQMKHLTKNTGIHFHEIMVWSGIDDKDLKSIFDGTDEYTQGGCVYVDRNEYQFVTQALLE